MIERFIKSYFREGALLVRLPGGGTVGVGGATEADARVIAVIEDAKTGIAIATHPHLALGEAYMDRRLRLERGTIYDLLLIISANFRYHQAHGAAATFQRGLERMLHPHTRDVSRKNVAHHYDLSVDLYRRFLDPDLQYSCAYFPRKGASLEEAQSAKKAHIAAKLMVSPGDRVLDIGCGWGGLGLTLAEEYGAEVTGVTLSQEQHGLANERAAARGLSRRARFLLQDYRDVRGPFDRIVSVGMFEHVGAENYQTYFDTIARQLTDEGVALVHTIGRVTGPARTSAWIAKYIFPGGYIPALSEIAPAIERAGLIVTDIEILRLHYAETLRAWRERFMAQRAEIAQLYDERFCRMWEFYLAGAEASFRVGMSVVFQIQIAKRVDAVPITRDYLYGPRRRERSAA